MRRSKTIGLSIWLIILFFKLEPAQAQPYTRDSSFNLGFNFFGPGSGGRIEGVLHEPDGKLLVYGSFKDALSDPYRVGIVKFLPNGQIDPSFYLPPNLTDSGPTYYIKATSYGYWVYTSPSTVIKLNHNGQQLDAQYRSNMFQDIGACSRSWPVMFQDSSLLMGGDWCAFPPVNPDKILHIMRILPNGKVDTTFQHTANEYIISMRRYDSSRIMCGGGFTAYDSIPIKMLCRIDTLGNLDTTFHSILTDGVFHIAHIQPDGKIIISGNFSIEGHTGWLAMVRLHPDGSLDSTFNNFNSINVDTDGTFTTICPTSDGGFLIGGYFTHYQGQPRNRIAKIDANGFLEPLVLSGTGIDSGPLPNFAIHINNISRGPNDQYYIAGWFDGFNGETVQPVIRLNGPLTVGVEPAIAKKAAVTVQPNPAAEKVRISLPSDAAFSGTCSLVLTDVTGRQILQQAFAGSDQEIPISHLPQGLYLLTVTEANGQGWQQKLIIYR